MLRSAGEMLLPFLIGLCFDRGSYWTLGAGLVVMEALVVLCTFIAWRVASLVKADEAPLEGNMEEMEEVRPEPQRQLAM